MELAPNKTIPITRRNNKPNENLHCTRCRQELNQRSGLISCSARIKPVTNSFLSLEKEEIKALRSEMVRNPKVSVDPIRVSKRLAEAKSVISGNPIVAVEARHKRNSNVAGSEGFSRKTEIIPTIADEPTRAKKIKAIKRGKRPFASRVPETDTSYKTLYFETKKKVEDLTEENHKLTIDLSYRSGQVDAFEYVIGNMKNVGAFSNTMRVPGADMNLSKGTAPEAPPLNLNHLG